MTNIDYLTNQGYGLSSADEQRSTVAELLRSGEWEICCYEQSVEGPVMVAVFRRLSLRSALLSSMDFIAGGLAKLPAALPGVN